jgi:hypothetical protein
MWASVPCWIFRNDTTRYFNNDRLLHGAPSQAVKVWSLKTTSPFARLAVDGTST